MKNQRKYMIRCMLVGLAGTMLLLPAASYAQTVTTTDNSQLIAVLTALVQVLEQEIASIQAQQATSTPVSAPSIGAVPAITNASTTIMADDTQEQAAQPAPQFAQAPTWAFTNGDRSQGVTGTWSTDIPATAVLYVSAQMGDTGDISGYQIQQTWNDATTSFTFTSPLLGTPFYAVAVTANGQTTTYKGSDYRSSIPH
jgi:hypothetical protein